MQGTLIALGAGHMGSAIVQGMLKNGHTNIKVIDPDGNKLTPFRDAGLAVDVTLTSVAPDDIIMLAMPPQAYHEFASSNPLVHGHPGLIVSVMAGIKIETISESLRATQIVRTIPNTPSEVFQGMTVYCASPETTAENLAKCKQVLESFGRSVQVDEESLIDPATALCGGGPAFAAYFVDAMQRFARDVGFDEDAAKLITVQVLKGTAELLAASPKPPMQICKEVMTPNGTTERGIWHFDQMGFGDIVKAALGKSTDRSAELGVILNRAST
jgi:pyrroline-5-carboxylate reductase